MTEVSLQTRGLSKHWGSFRANHEIDVAFAAGARHALIGPNGAGKTTFVNLLTGVLQPSAGQIWLNGQDVTLLAQHQRVKRGMARTFQINTLFSELTVLESVVLAVCERNGTSSQWWRPIARYTAEIEEAHELLRTLRLEHDAARMTRELPYGKQRLLELALALALRPQVLLLDEPAAGVPKTDSHEILETIAALPRDVSIIFIEHDMELVFRFAERITVLVAGQVLSEGTPDEIARDERVQQVYLGESESV